MRAFPWVLACWMAGLILPVSAGDAYRLEAALEEGRTGFMIRVQGDPLPDGALLTVRLMREVGPRPSPHPLVLQEDQVPVTEAGRAEQALETGDLLKTPGRYAVSVFLDPEAQVAGVLAVLGGAKPPPVTAVLTDDTASKAYVDALLEDEAYLISVFRRIRNAVDRLGALQTQVRQDHDKGVEAWRVWRAVEIPPLEEVLVRSPVERERFFPGTFMALARLFLADGLLFYERTHFDAVANRTSLCDSGMFRGRERIEAKDMEPFLRHFLVEAFEYRLAVLRSLAASTVSEVEAQGRRADRTRWDRKRAGWEAALAAWGADLETLAAQDAVDLPRRPELAALGKALSAWWAAEQAGLFEPKDPAAGQASGRKAAFQEKLKALSRFEALPPLVPGTPPARPAPKR